MATVTSKGYLARALDQRIVELVGINEVKLITFSRPTPGHPVTLGVRGLSACSVIVVASEFGAIVAHVGPNIPDSQDPGSYIRLAHDRMDVLEALYRQNHDLVFGQDSNAYVIYAAFQNTAQSPEQLGMFRDRLGNLGLTIVGDQSYTLSAAEAISDSSPLGTVWVVKQHNAPTSVYLEDRLVKPRAVPSSLQRQLPEPSSASSSRTSRALVSRSRMWTRIAGDDEYKLRDQDGHVMESCEQVPRDTWVYLYDRAGTFLAKKKFDGVKWTQD